MFNKKNQTKIITESKLITEYAVYPDESKVKNDDEYFWQPDHYAELWEIDCGGEIKYEVDYSSGKYKIFNSKEEAFQFFEDIKNEQYKIADNKKDFWYDESTEENENIPSI